MLVTANIRRTFARFALELARPRLALASEGGRHGQRPREDQHGPERPAAQRDIAGTGPGIPDEALAPGEELPEPPSDEEVERVAEKIGAPTAERDTLPLEGE